MRVKSNGEKLRKSNLLPLNGNKTFSARDDNKNYRHQNHNTSSNEDIGKYDNNYGCQRQECVGTLNEEEITFQLSNLELQNNEHAKERTTELIGTHTEIKHVSKICHVKQHENDNETGEDNASKISTESKTNNNITEIAEVRKQSVLIPRGKYKQEKKSRSNRMKEYEWFPQILEKHQSPSVNNINITETGIDELPSCSFTHSLQEPTLSANNSSEQSEESIPADLEDVLTPLHINMDQESVYEYLKTLSPCPTSPFLQEILSFDQVDSEISTTQNFNATSQEPSQIFQNQGFISQPYRDQLLKRLHPTKKKEALVKVSLVTDTDLIMPDEDGDTLLMCLVSQPNDSLLELVFFITERIRNIQNALNHKNKMGQTVLYVASINQPQEPLIACYIAETLLDLGVDIAQERYWRGCTLIQCLRLFGDSHANVLANLLSMKDASGRTVFASQE